MNKIAAVVFTLGTLVLIAVGGWGLLYLPAKMEAAAKGAIADFNQVLARSNPPLRLTYGAVSANPITATVTITDAALGRTSGAALRAGEIVPLRFHWVICQPLPSLVIAHLSTCPIPLSQVPSKANRSPMRSRPSTRS